LGAKSVRIDLLRELSAFQYVELSEECPYYGLSFSCHIVSTANSWAERVPCRNIRGLCKVPLRKQIRKGRRRTGLCRVERVEVIVSDAEIQSQLTVDRHRVLSIDRCLVVNASY